MSHAVDVLLALLVLLSSASIDFASARYVRAVGSGRAHRAATWSVVQWASSLVGFLVVVKYTLWMLPAEMCGLYLGTLLSLTRLGGTRVDGTRVDRA